MKSVLKLLALLFLALSFSCGSDDGETNADNSNNPDNPSTSLAESGSTFQNKVSTLEVPAALKENDDSNAQIAFALFTQFQGLSNSFSQLFSIPENANLLPQAGNKNLSDIVSETYTWSAGDTTIRFEISENDDSYTYDYSIISPEYTGKFMTGFVRKDGSLAELQLFSTNDSSLTASIIWNTTSIENRVRIITEGAVLDYRSPVDSTSGSIAITEDGILTGTYIWNADGSGSFRNEITNETFSWTA